MKPENYEKVLKLVANADETEIAGIVEVIIARRQTLARAKKAETLSKLHPGCRVRLQGLKPKYLNGARTASSSTSSLPARSRWSSSIPTPEGPDALATLRSLPRTCWR